MYAIEFRTKIRNGIIEIPKKHRSKIRENVRVIIIAEETPVEADYIERLFNKPIKLKEFKPLSRDETYERN
jgi:hypothetical protein